MTEPQQRRKDDKFPGRLFRFFRLFFVIVGMGATFSVVCLTVTLIKVLNYVPPAMPDKILLTYTFKAGLADVPGKPSLSQPLLRPAATLRDVVQALDSAQKDARVKGFVAKLQDISFSVAQAQELRDAVTAFRKSGKFAYIYADSFGGFSPGMADYYLGAAFDEIWLQPVGVVGINGVGAEVPFARGILDKVGILPQFSHKGIYKSASESLTATDISKPNREATEDLVNDLYSQMVTGIAADRHFTEDKFKRFIDAAPYTDKESLSLKLVDHVGYYDEALDAARKKADLADEKSVDLLGYSFLDETTKLDLGMPGFVYKFMWKSAPAASMKDKRKIALVYGAGEIVPYKSSHGTFGEGGMAAEKIVKAFEDVQKDDDVAAVVFRINSPGGSPQASETIRRAMLETAKKGKPVIVSMGSTAASGGYWISTGASKIVAQPATITGSIGVFGGKLVMTPLWDKLGINFVGITRGENARIWSGNKAFSDAEYARFNSMLDNTYEAFLQRVMEGRKMTHDQAEAVAEGRVWTGREAKDKGLVDELGGLDVAIDIAKKEAKLDNVKDVPVEQFPGAKSTIEEFLTLATEGALFTPNIDAEDLMRQLLAEEMSKNSILPASLVGIR